MLNITEYRITDPKNIVFDLDILKGFFRNSIPIKGRTCHSIKLTIKTQILFMKAGGISTIEVSDELPPITLLKKVVKSNDSGNKVENKYEAIKTLMTVKTGKINKLSKL